MQAKISTWALLTAAAFLSSGCDNGNDDDDSAVRPVLAAFNAVSDLPPATFLREEEVWSSIDYGVSTDFKGVDADQYDVSFDVLLPGDETTSCSGDVDKDEVKDTNECTRVSETSINLIADREYIVALTGSYGNLTARVYDDAAHEFDTRTDDGDGEDEDAQVQFFNWSSELGAFDVYLERPGTNLTATQVKATLAPGEKYTGMVDDGTYVLTLSPVANPNAAFYTSENFTIEAQTRVAFGILDGTDASTSTVKVSRFRDQGGDLLDRRVKTLMRLSHVAPDVGNVDVFLEEDYSAPAFANLTLKQTSVYREIDPTILADLELDITPAGNVGVLLSREETTLSKGERATYFLVKSSNGSVDGLKASDTVRRLAPYGQLRPVNSLTTSLDFYIIPHGNNIYTSTATQTLSAASIGSSQTFEPGSYDVVIARAGTDTFVFGPREVQIEGGGIYTIAAVPTAQTTVADTLFLDDFSN